MIGRADTLTALITSVITNGTNALENYPPQGPEKTNNTCERDVGLIIDGMILDIGNGTNANINAIQAAKRYFSTASGAKARVTQGTQTLAALRRAKAIVRNVVSNVDLLTQSKRFSVLSNRFNKYTIPN